jgi:hypothetical protein
MGRIPSLLERRRLSSTLRKSQDVVARRPGLHLDSGSFTADLAKTSERGVGDIGDGNESIALTLSALR